MLTSPLCLYAGHIHWLSLVIFCLSILCVCCLTTEPTLIFSYDDSTPFPNAVKCYTCTNTKNNHECNRRAYDAFCPRGTKYCYTSHHIDHVTGESLFVNKLCATKGECTPSSVGCFDTHQPEVKKCISCCEGTKCNLGVPTNTSTAVFTTTTPYSHATHTTASNTLTASCIALTTLLIRGWL